MRRSLLAAGLFAAAAAAAAAGRADPLPPEAERLNRTAEADISKRHHPGNEQRGPLLVEQHPIASHLDMAENHYPGLIGKPLINGLPCLRPN